jgi:glucose-1-phosphate cytidylyltransferase
VKLVETGEETMTGGRPKRVAEYIGDDTFCLTYADYVSDVDIAQPVPFHREQAVLATLTAIEPRGALEPSPRGGRNEDHDVPRKATGRRRLDQRGFFLVEPQVLDYIAAISTVWDREPLEQLAQEGSPGRLQAP